MENTGGDLQVGSARKTFNNNLSPLLRLPRYDPGVDDLCPPSQSTEQCQSLRLLNEGGMLLANKFTREDFEVLLQVDLG